MVGRENPSDKSKGKTHCSFVLKGLLSSSRHNCTALILYITEVGMVEIYS